MREEFGDYRKSKPEEDVAEDAMLARGLRLARGFDRRLSSLPMALVGSIFMPFGMTVEAPPEADEDEQAEEGEPLRKPKPPLLPKIQEQDEHRTTHIPFRSWCEHCICGRGLGEQRGRHALAVAVTGVLGFEILEVALARRLETLGPIGF